MITNFSTSNIKSLTPKRRTFTRYVNQTLQSVEYLVIAGGGGAGGPETVFAGGGWNGGGGGAGGYRSSVSGETSGDGASAESPLSVTAGTSYTVTIGAGGAGGAGAGTEGSDGTNGNNSVFGSITSTGGGGGGGGRGQNATGKNGKAGGSGGGGGTGQNAGGTGGAKTSGQGFAGAAGAAGGYGGGGGGAGAIGADANTRGKAAGVASLITGSSTTRGVGGSSGVNNAANIDGPANSGDGGDLPSGFNGNGRAGGSGVVIIRYPNAYGTSTTTGSPTTGTYTSGGTEYRFYTFTGSGTWTCPTTTAQVAA